MTLPLPVPRRRPALLGLLALLPQLGLGQQLRFASAPWRDEPAARAAATAAELPQLLTDYRAFSLDGAALRGLLATAPPEGAAPRAGQATILTLPLPDGASGRFRLVEAPVMVPELAAQFPQIRTYAGVGLDDSTATIRCDFTPQGFHAQVLSAAMGTVYIDPVSRTDAAHYVSYFKRALNHAARGPRPICSAEAVPASPTPPARRGASAANAGNVALSVGSTLRTYRLAVAATAEYTLARGGTVTSALSAITTSVNRVVGVYERELAVRLVLIANEPQIIFTSTTTDPYTNDSPSALLTQNQATLASSIGLANFDIGHVFSTAGGGIATLRSVCSTVKAQGETGTPNPVGDAFDIDYVAHEMGHQFGANHPFNGTQLNCGGGNRNATTAWEPGSGSTIMAYAGICSTDDLQPHSDAYFHSGSFEEVQAFISSSAGACFTAAATGNTPPTVTVPAAKTIPKGTPFQLTATGADANADALTYCWEELDLGPAGPPKPATQVAGQTLPLFRSYPPGTSRTRYFPRLNELRNNTTAKGETLPTVARPLKFRCTVRDQHLSTLGFVVGGVTTSPLVTLTVASTAGPFTVTAPNLSTVVWTVGTTATVTWSVANTNVAPVNCQSVKILLSRDGGLTFPTTLLASTPNDGSQTITVPNLPTTQARVMVQAADNYFFDISNVNFVIASAAVGRGIVTSVQPDSSVTCAARPTSYLVSVVPLAGFADSVQLSVTGLPPYATATFQKSRLLPPDTTLLVVTVDSAAAPGTYTLTITATGGNQTQHQTVELIVQPTLAARVLPQYPPNLAPGQGPRPTFRWSPVTGATQYMLELATDAQFTPPILMRQAGLTDAFYQSRSLALDTTLNYYWRVTAATACDSGLVSVPFTFGPGGTTGLSAALADAALAVVPNPSAGGDFTLTLRSEVAGMVRLNVVDAVGRQVWTDEQAAANLRDYSLHLRAQPAGIYALRLVLPDGRVVRRRLVKL